MRYMLDTNICIYLIKHKSQNVLNQLKNHIDDDICISSITYSELCYGVEKSQYKERNRVALIAFLSSVEIFPYGMEASEEYGKIRAYLERQSMPIGSLDMLIGAHAKTEGCILVTNNTGEFERILGLKIEDWTK